MRGSQVSLDGKTPQMPIKKQACAITPSGMFYDPSKARSERAEITRERLGVAAASMTPDTVIVGNPPWNFEWATTDASDDDRFFVYKNGSQRWDEVSVMDWEKKMQVRVFQTPSEVNVLKVSPDGKYVATAGNDKRIYLWDLGGL
jgi:WD40 repeat protein